MLCEGSLGRAAFPGDALPSYVQGYMPLCTARVQDTLSRPLAGELFPDSTNTEAPRGWTVRAGMPGPQVPLLAGDQKGPWGLGVLEALLGGGGGTSSQQGQAWGWSPPTQVWAFPQTSSPMSKGLADGIRGDCLLSPDQPWLESAAALDSR